MENLTLLACKGYLRGRERTKEMFKDRPSLKIKSKIKPRKMKYFLLSGQGARHEDRLPDAIFTSLELVRDYLKDYAINYYKTVNAVVSEHPPYKGDYGDCIEFVVHHPNDVDCEDAVGFVVDSFEVDPEITK